MTKPDDIPQDVWDIAASAYFGAWNAHDEHFNPASNSISDGLSLRFIEASARSIMAERKRCIEVVTDYRAFRGDTQGDIGVACLNIIVAMEEPDA